MVKSMDDTDGRHEYKHKLWITVITIIMFIIIVKIIHRIIYSSEMEVLTFFGMQN